MGQVLLVILFMWPQGPQPSSDATVRFNRAVELQQKGALKEAAAEYQAILAVAPNYAEAHANLGVVLAQMGQYEQAVAAYESALRLAPNFTPILLNLGIAHYRAGQFEKAVDAFERFLTEKPEALQARQLLGISLVELGLDAKAVTHLERTRTTAPNDPAVLYSLGLAYLRLGRPEVRTMVQHLAASSAGLPASHLLQGQALLARHEYERAIAELDTAAGLNAELPRLQYSLGLCYLKLGRNREAITAFESELRRKPEDFSTLFYLAYLQETEGKLDAAQKRLDLALRLEPDSAEANALLGKILLKEGKAAEALSPLERAVSKEPTDPEKRYQLARVYQQLGRGHEAAREFAEVQRLKAEQLKTDRARTPR